MTTSAPANRSCAAAQTTGTTKKTWPVTPASWLSTSSQTTVPTPAMGARTTSGAVRSTGRPSRTADSAPRPSRAMILAECSPPMVAAPETRQVTIVVMSATAAHRRAERGFRALSDRSRAPFRPTVRGVESTLRHRHPVRRLNPRATNFVLPEQWCSGRGRLVRGLPWT
jgi:hypothetical protein